MDVTQKDVIEEGNEEDVYLVFERVVAPKDTPLTLIDLRSLRDFATRKREEFAQPIEGITWDDLSLQLTYTRNLAASIEIELRLCDIVRNWENALKMKGMAEIEVDINLQSSGTELCLTGTLDQTKDKSEAQDPEQEKDENVTIDLKVRFADTVEPSEVERITENLKTIMDYFKKVVAEQNT